jgi:hypothetical protein
MKPTKKPADTQEPPLQPTVNHDLDWFAFENRVRTTVFQLIDPI